MDTHLEQFYLHQIPELLSRLKLLRAQAEDAVLAHHRFELTTDSRKVKPGTVFLCYKGVASDGHSFLEAAIANKPAALIIEDQNALPKSWVENPALAVPWFQVRNGREAWAYLCAAMEGNPQDQLKIAAITGTNGKSSTMSMVRSLLELCGHPCVALGTIGAWVGSEKIELKHTTPDPDVLYSLLAKGVKKGIRFAVMEAASQALLHRKLEPMRFSAVAFTSFTRDHLDLHGTMEDYFAAKWRLFTTLLPTKTGCAVICDSVQFKGKNPIPPQSDAWLYGSKKIEDFSHFAQSAKILDFAELGAYSCLWLDIDGQRIHGEIPFVGSFLRENFVAALLLATKLLGYMPPPSLWPKVAMVPGRLEEVMVAQGLTEASLPRVWVDYAHTPDALEKALSAIREVTKNGRLRVVFGCGGDRDRGKRPQMGDIAARLADDVFVTSDNPRNEDPDKIIGEILTGIQRGKNPIAITDRAKAISMAISTAHPQDCILICGKGHENYQIIGGQTLEFDDCKVAKAALAVFKHSQSKEKLS